MVVGMAERILIVGMNNPLSSDPRLALWPDPVNCTGWRLWKMTSERTGATRHQYTRAFDRTNMVVGRWTHSAAVQWWQENNDQILEQYDVCLLLGAATRSAAGMSRLPELCIRGGIATLPHPSGLNRWYNERVNKAAAEILLEELYLRATGA
jgi:hypothetical protein